MDSSDSVFVVGYAYSTDLTTTVGAYDITYNGEADVFVSKFYNLYIASPCEAKKLDVKPKSLKLSQGEDREETITLTCKKGLPSVNQIIKVKIVSGKKHVTISPAEAYTDENGQATFTITATEKKGNAVVRFKHKNLINDVTVKVRKQ